MARKIGTDFVNDMVDRGRRELSGVLYGDSNIAQPMYPLRGSYEASKEVGGLEDHGSIVGDRLKQIESGRGDQGRDDRGIDRE
jgi:hypothetical protein